MKLGNTLTALVLAPSVANARRWASAASLALVLAGAASASAQSPGYVYVANETLNEVDVLRASDHVLIASMPTIATPFGMAATQDGKQDLRLDLRRQEHLRVRCRNQRANLHTANWIGVARDHAHPGRQVSLCTGLQRERCPYCYDQRQHTDGGYPGRGSSSYGGLRRWRQVRLR